MQKHLPHLSNNVKDFVIPSTVGASSIFAVINLQATASVLVAVVTIAAMLPVAIQRWQKFLAKKSIENESNPPIKPQ